MDTIRMLLDMFNTLKDPNIPTIPPDAMYDRGVEAFCRELHAQIPDSENLVVLSAEYRKYHRTRFEHESVVLGIGTVLPDSDELVPNMDPVFIEFERIGKGFFPVWGRAVDRVIIYGANNNPIQDDRERFVGLYWYSQFPTLLDVVNAIRCLSILQPTYTLLSYQCYWYADAVAFMLNAAYPYHHVIHGTRSWRRCFFTVIPVRIGQASAREVVVEIAKHQRQCRNVEREAKRRQRGMY